MLYAHFTDLVFLQDLRVGMLVLLLVISVGGLGLTEAANILGMLPLPAFSHTNGYLPIFEELARRGHNVTVVSPFPREKPLANYTDVVITNTMPQLMARMNFDLHDMNSFIPDLIGLWLMCPVLIDSVFELPELSNFINEDRSHFDAIITETFFCQEMFATLAHKYSAHLIALHPLALGSIENDYIGNSMPYSYVPNQKVSATDVMSFKDRFLSALFYTSELLIHKLIFSRIQENYATNFFKYPGWESRPPLTEILRNHSLVLLDSHISLSYPRPYTPNIVQFGGLSVKAAKPLPKDLEEYISSSEEGVVFLTWGSHYKSTNMKNETLRKFLSVFSKLKQKVLMKWENPELPGKPANMRIQSWFPQASILSHPKVKVFISHCGIHGLSEAMYNGVPILGTPVFGDQYNNLKIAQKAGMALFLDIDHFTEEELLGKLNKLIYDPSYKKAALRQSAIFKDRPQSALDSAVYWIEYVLRHDGARHLRPVASDLPFYQYFLLDLIGAALGGVFLVFSLLYFALRALYRRFKSKPKSIKKNKKE